MSFLYQVTQPDGRVMMQTVDPSCRYPSYIERALQQAGFKIVLKGSPPQEHPHT